MSTDIPPIPETPPQPTEDVPRREPPEREAPDERSPEDVETPDDVEPGSDADIDRGGAEAEEPSPGGLATDQKDDNIDEYGRRQDGTTLDQPGSKSL